MKFPFHVYLDKFEGVAKDAAAAAPGLWASPRAPVGNLRQVTAPGAPGLSARVHVIAEYVPPTVMRHIVESQPRVIIALIGMIRVLVDRVAKHEGDLRSAHALLQRARQWVPDPKLGDEIDTMLRLPCGTVQLSAEVDGEGVRSLDFEIEVPE